MRAPDGRSENPLDRCRSYLFVPGSRLDRFDKARQSGADAIIIDLEDAVAPSAKDAARTAVSALLRQRPSEAPRILVRINGCGTRAGLQDCLALIDPACKWDAILVPKVDGPGDIQRIADLAREARCSGGLGALIETTTGVEDVVAIAAASPRLKFLMIGGADLAAELRVAVASPLLDHARARLVYAAACYGLGALEMPWLDLDDIDGYRADLERSFALGFTARAAIHPRQIEAIHAALTPGVNDVAWARRVVTAFEQADGGAFSLDGKLVEQPVVERCRRIIMLADAAEHLNEERSI
jgi:(S)-citramalyl-CoA lyase